MSSYPRYRLFADEWLNGFVKTTIKNSAGVITSQNDNSVYHSSSVKDDMYDIVVPDFYLRSQKGEVIINPMQHVRVERRGGGGSYFARNTSTNQTIEHQPHDGGSLTVWRYAGYPVARPSAWQTYSDREAVAMHTAKQQALAGIDKTPYAFMEDLFELRSTIDFLKGHCASAAELAAKYQKAKKKFLKGGADSAKASADAWLTVRYGYAPIVRSIVSILESINANPTRPSRSQSSRTIPVDSGYLVNNGQNSGVYFTTTAEIRGLCKAGIYYQISNPLTDWHWKYGLRLKDVPTNIWAVVPYSWVVDRFLDVSAFCKATINILDPQIRILGGYTKRKYIANETMQYTHEVSSGWTISVNGDLVNDQTSVTVRDIWSPSFTDALPIFKIDKDVAHLADLAALVLQRLRK